MNDCSYDICVCHTTFGLLLFFPGVFLHSRVTGACPVTTDLIMRVNVRTKTTRREAQKNPVDKKFSRKRPFSTHGSDCVRIGLMDM